MSFLPSIEGISTLEPLSMLFIVLVQIGGRYLRIELTPAQQKLINNPIFQTVILFCIILMTTKCIVKSFIIVFVMFICVNILFNENHKYNILSKKWLLSEKIITGKTYKPLKHLYIKNMLNVI